MKYNHQQIEQKWQKEWEKSGIYKEYSRPQSFYALDMFPYPSGSGLHVGHPKGYIATDVVSRMKMLQGYSVLHPMGWDAFGLPAENYAIANSVHPANAVEHNIDVFKQQLKKIGFTYDWDREINTTDPTYYKWTQLIFLRLFEHGLAYEADEPINWCPSCKTGLANEDLEEGKCERCGSVVEQKKMWQWKLRMTAYADRLLEDLDKEKLDWEEAIKIQQRNWIGRSEGAIIRFCVRHSGEPMARPESDRILDSARPRQDDERYIEVFTTRLDTILGCTYCVVAPEHPIIENPKLEIRNSKEVMKYVGAALKKTPMERQKVEKEKTGVKLEGVNAVNPFTNEEAPVFVADYVLGSYGTGAVMAVPAHDERDFEFAKKYGLPIKTVIVPSPRVGEGEGEVRTAEGAFIDDGVLVDSGQYSGLASADAREKMAQWLEETGQGKRAVHYKMRDWVFSRQRYWGEPIPMVHCDVCKKKKYQYVLIHGFRGSSQEVYQPWLKQQLEQQGHTVVALDLPHAEHPNVDEQVQHILKTVTITNDTILIGRSLGGIVMMKLLEKIKTPVRRSVFVDPVVTPHFNDHVRPLVEQSNNWEFDDARIRQNAGEITILADANHPIIRKEDLDALHQRLHATQTVTVQPNDAHFDSPQEPEILKALESIGTVPLKPEDLPLRLPEIEQYEPTGTGESPLAGIAEWVHTICPRCGALARRETNTMPQWAGSSWYYLRYIDPKNGAALVDLKKEQQWMPVDLYVGGAEHATRHLLYARFWHKFLYDIGVVSTIEPFQRLVNVGLILAEDGRKMSKRWDNVINPDDVIAEYGADSLRLYEMFMGPFTQSIAWSTDGVKGVRRFLDRAWNLKVRIDPNSSIEYRVSSIDRLLHQTIKKVTDDIEGFRFNTAVSQLMILLNTFEQHDSIPQILYSQFLILLSPFAPHIAEELWHQLGNKDSIFLERWPVHDAAFAKEETVEFVVQVNGKVRDRFELPAGLTQGDVEKCVFKRAAVKNWIAGRTPQKNVFVQDKLLNIVLP